MTAVPKRKLTAAEYLALERTAAVKSEFFDGEMFAMAGASREHNRVKENLAIEIGSRIKGGRCQSFSSDQRVLIPSTGLYAYPDVVIVCGEPEYADHDRDTLTNPRVLVEVLSDSTERYDRRTKFRHYEQLPSFQEYVLVAQDEPLVERYVRQPDGTWVFRAFTELADTFALATVPAEVPMADVYRGVTFPPAPPPPQRP
jgi:Uma2 family endonuclease